LLPPGRNKVEIFAHKFIFFENYSEPGYNFRDLTGNGIKPVVGVAEMRCGQVYAFFC